MKQFEFLENKVFNNVWLCDNHNNGEFLEYWDKFYTDEIDFNRVKRNFHYNMKKLVECGMCKKIVSHTSARDFSNFGRKTIITYQPLITKKNVNPKTP